MAGRFLRHPVCVLVGDVAASNKQCDQQSSQTPQQFNSSAFPSTSLSNQMVLGGPSTSSSSSLSTEDAVNLQNPFADSPKTFGYSRSVGNCGPSSYPVSDYGHGHRIEAYHDGPAYPRNLDGGYCTGMTSYQGSHCSEPCFNQYVELLLLLTYLLTYLLLLLLLLLLM